MNESSESSGLWTPEFHQKEIDKHYASVTAKNPVISDSHRISAGAHRYTYIALSQRPSRKVHQQAAMAHRVAANQGDPASKALHLKMEALHKSAMRSVPMGESAEPFSSSPDSVAEAVSEVQEETLKEWESDSTDPVTGPDMYQTHKGRDVLAHDTYSSKLKRMIPKGTSHEEWLKLHGLPAKPVKEETMSEEVIDEAKAEPERGTYLFHIKHSHPRDTAGKPRTIKFCMRNSTSLRRATRLVKAHLEKSGSKIHSFQFIKYTPNPKNPGTPEQKMKA